MRTFIIAEAGVNHNGDIKIAKKLIDAAADSGADAVKFQTFRAEHLVNPDVPKADYQARATGGHDTQYEMLRKLELDVRAHKELIGHCLEKGILFLSTPFDMESIHVLHKLGLKIFKVPSGEITNLPYLKMMGALKKKIILSTGMSDLGEIEDALNVLTAAGTPREHITVLHCNTEYPTPFEDVNLLAMITIQQALKVNAGYSDHTTGIEVPVAAAALGASVIEKHFTLDRNMTGPDHSASLESHELKAMVRAIRNIERALGDGIKRPSPSELRNRTAVRKSIVASRRIKKGEMLSEETITAKRPGTGISPMEWDRIVGKTATRDFEEDALIEV